jgi:hypothetical protein
MTKLPNITANPQTKSFATRRASIRLYRGLAGLFAITGVLLAVSSWIPFWKISAGDRLATFSGMQVTGHLTWGLVATGALACIFGGAMALGRSVPRYVFALLASTSVVLAGFFALLVNQLSPSDGHTRLVLLADTALWSTFQHTTVQAHFGVGLYLAAGAALFMVALTYPLTRHLFKDPEKP